MTDFGTTTHSCSVCDCMEHMCPSFPSPPPVIVMGVSGSGKSTVGAALAVELAQPFIDADDLHSPQNRAKMAAGVPLTDADRLPWLRDVGRALANTPERPPIIACSALKAEYRRMLREYTPDLACVYLWSDPETIAQRLAVRSHAFMPQSLLTSQFAALEAPTDEMRVLALDVRTPVDKIVQEAVSWLRSLPPLSPTPRPRT